jgi:hypothetical protein
MVLLALILAARCQTGGRLSRGKADSSALGQNPFVFVAVRAKGDICFLPFFSIIMNDMKTVSVQLPEAVIDQIRALSKASAMRPAAIMRRAIEKEANARSGELNGLEAMRDLVGLIPDGPKDLARNHKKHIRMKARA